MAVKPTLGYWNIRGLAQHIRFLLAYLEVDYEEKRYECENREEWLADKETLGLDFPNVPYWKEDGKIISESRAINLYLCKTRKPELLGSTEDVQVKVDTVDGFLYDFIIYLAQAAYENTEALHAEFQKDAPVKMGYLNKVLSNSEWVTGSEITYVDFYAYEALHDYQVYNPNGLDSFPQLREFQAKIEAIPAIRDYMSSPTYLDKPIFMDTCKMKI